MDELRSIRQRGARPPIGDGGFSLIEVVFATFVLVTGLVSVAQLLPVSVMMNTDARYATHATEQAQAKIDELIKTNFNAPALQVNTADTLSSNVANYFDTPAPGVTRRWQITAGPSDTRTVTVRVIDTRALRYGRRTQLTTIVRQW
jgi:Tfp pilus assembly protein PilV